MKLVMIYDQIQSGLGTKDDKMLPLAIIRETVGSAVMMAPFLEQMDAHIMATLYCGNGFFMADQDETSRKLCAMVKKLEPDMVICGPAFNYKEYAMMCGRVASDIRRTTGIRAIAAMSEENEETIARYKADIPIVRTPAKGEAGLRESLKHICELVKTEVAGEDLADIKKKWCYE